MDINEFVEKFAEQFDDTDPSEITATTNFHDLDEWSSLIGLSVIAMVDEEFDVALKGDDVKDSVTVEVVDGSGGNGIGLGQRGQRCQAKGQGEDQDLFHMA